MGSRELGQFTLCGSAPPRENYVSGEDAMQLNESGIESTAAKEPGTRRAVLTKAIDSRRVAKTQRRGAMGSRELGGISLSAALRLRVRTTFQETMQCN